jgi:hypothetical protein
VKRTAFVSTASPLKVRFPGSSAQLPALKNAAYTPTVGDRVAVETLDETQLYVDGKVG